MCKCIFFLLGGFHPANSLGGEQDQADCAVGVSVFLSVLARAVAYTYTPFVFPL